MDISHRGGGAGGGSPSFWQRATSRRYRRSSIDSAFSLSRSAWRAAFFAVTAASFSHLASTWKCAQVMQHLCNAFGVHKTATLAIHSHWSDAERLL